MSCLALERPARKLSDDFDPDRELLTVTGDGDNGSGDGQVSTLTAPDPREPERIWLVYPPTWSDSDPSVVFSEDDALLTAVQNWADWRVVGPYVLEAE